MKFVIFLLLVAALGVFIYKQVQKTRAYSVPTPQGVKDAPNDKA